jgi:hypothetical protein
VRPANDELTRADRVSDLGAGRQKGDDSEHAEN